MTSYAMFLSAQDSDGRQTRVWAIAPSPAAARALIEAYREMSGIDDAEILEPALFDAAQAAAAGFDDAPGTSRLFCLIRDPARADSREQQHRAAA